VESGRSFGYRTHMRIIFIYGQPASGKLTIARELAERTGIALFHNHLVVDALEAVFPFGSEAFVRLREQFWLAVFAEAAQADRSLIFTFAPEPTVALDFTERVRTLVQSVAGEVMFVAVTVPPEEQERRLMRPDRAAFGKLRSVDLLRRLREDFAACAAAMPAPTLTVDTSIVEPGEAAAMIARMLRVEPPRSGVRRPR
jgi:chloramphenicol 3-O-phosphotransferase